MEREKLISLVVAAQQHDSNAATELYDGFYNDIYYHILKLVNNDSELAADLTQDTFVQILESIDQLEEPAAFVTWSQRIAFSKCTGYFKKKKEFLADEEEDGYSIFDTQEETREDFLPDEALDKEDLKKTIQKMINELPDEQRSALLLRYFNEISVKEIAEIQGVSEGTVKSRLNYARKAIKASVEEYEKKNDIKLHCAGVIPLLLWFFRTYRSANGISLTATVASTAFESGMGTAAGSAAATATAAASTASIATGTATATTASAVTASGGVSTIAGILSTKVIAIIATAAVAIGGVSVGVALVEDHDNAYEGVVITNLEDNSHQHNATENLLGKQSVTEETASLADEEFNNSHTWIHFALSRAPMGEEKELLLECRICTECFEYEALFQNEGLNDCEHDWNHSTDVHEIYIIEYRYCMWYGCNRHECLAIYKNNCLHQWQKSTNTYYPYECALCGCPRWIEPEDVLIEDDSKISYYQEDTHIAETEETTEDIVITITPVGSTQKDGIPNPDGPKESEEDSEQTPAETQSDVIITITPVGSTEKDGIEPPKH